MKTEEIRSMTENEIEDKIAESRDKLFKQRMQKSMGQAENPHKIRQTRKDIARFITILAEKRSNNGKGNESGTQERKTPGKKKG
jgi:large subunit ribosomal protein L29